MSETDSTAVGRSKTEVEGVNQDGRNEETTQHREYKGVS